MIKLKGTSLFILLTLILITQLVLLLRYPTFFRSFDLILLGIVSASVLGETGIALSFAFLSATILDLISPIPFINSVIYLSVVLLLSSGVLSRFLRFGSFILIALISAFLYKIFASYIIISLVYFPLQISQFFHLNYAGILAYIVASFLLSIWLDKVIGKGKTGELSY